MPSICVYDALVLLYLACKNNSAPKVLNYFLKLPGFGIRSNHVQLISFSSSFFVFPLYFQSLLLFVLNAVHGFEATWFWHLERVHQILRPSIAEHHQTQATISVTSLVLELLIIAENPECKIYTPLDDPLLQG